MKTRKPKNPDLVSQEKAASSWVGKIIRDSFENILGLVIGTEWDGDNLFLQVRFPGEKTFRKVYLDPRPDGNCLTPDMPKARYRPPRPEDLEKLKQQRLANKAKRSN